MTRHIYCRKCGEASIKRGLHAVDRAMGWKFRCVYISAQKPEGHGITVITETESTFSPLSDIECDGCGRACTGEVAIARTMWRDVAEPPMWETEYGNILPEAAVKTLDKLET